MLENFSDNLDTEKAIVKAMAFFDSFNYPLTSFEIWQYLDKNLDYDIFLKELENLVKKGIIKKKDGVYFFHDREILVELRKKRYFYTQRKIKIAKKWFGFFNLFIGLKAVYIANIIGSNNLKDSGDIDLFIITKNKRLWSSRFLLAFLGKLFNLRPKPGQERDKLCFSFFVDENNLDLEDLKIKNDLYFIYWLVGLSPLNKTDKEYFFKILKNNSWLKKYLPNYFKINVLDKYNIESKEESKNIIKEFKLNFFEKISKKLQLKIFPKEIKDRANKNKSIIINNGVLKLHVTDRRELFYERYLEIIKKYENKN